MKSTIYKGFFLIVLIGNTMGAIIDENISYIVDGAMTTRRNNSLKVTSDKGIVSCQAIRARDLKVKRLLAEAREFAYLNGRDEQVSFNFAYDEVVNFLIEESFEQAYGNILKNDILLFANTARNESGNVVILKIDDDIRIRYENVSPFGLVQNELTFFISNWQLCSAKEISLITIENCRVSRIFDLDKCKFNNTHKEVFDIPTVEIETVYVRERR